MDPPGTYSMNMLWEKADWVEFWGVDLTLTPLAVISPETVVCAVGAQISNDIFVIQPAHHRDLVLQQHLKT